MCEANGTNRPHYHPPDEAAEGHVEAQVGDMAGLGAVRVLGTHAR